MAEEIVKVKVDLDVAEFSKNAKAMSDALSKVLGRDVEIFNGKINKTAKLVENTEKALGGAATAANKAGNAVKQTNQQWTNFALVIQDLPYGFRGIQNNLPALVGGFASLTGPIYLAVSAVVALFTALDAGLISFGNKIKLSVDYSKEFSTTLADQKVKLDSLYRASTNSNASLEDRITAAKKLKEEYPKLLENFSAEEIAAGKAKDAYNKLSEAVIRYAKAEAAQTVIKEVVAKQLANEAKIAEMTLDLTAANNSAKKRQAEIDKKNLIYASGTLNLEAVRASTIQDNIDKLKAQNTELDKTLKKYTDIYDANVTFDLDKNNGGPTTKLEDNSIALLKSRQQYYKDDILMFASYEQEIIKRQAELDIKQAKLEGKSAVFIKNIRLRRDQDILNSAKNAADRILAIEQKLGEEEGKELQKRIDEAEKYEKELKVIDDRNLQNSLDALKLESEVRTKLLNRTNKTDTEGRIKVLEDYKNKLYDLASIGGYTEDQLDKINDAIVRIDAAIEGSKPVLKSYESNWTDTTNQIFDVVNRVAENILSQLGENLGKALAGQNVDVLGGFGELIGGALEEVGKALIAYGVAIKAFQLAQVNPYAAVAAGIALVAAGSALKAKFGKAQSTVGGGPGGGFGNANSNNTSGAIGARPSFGLLGQSPNNNTGNNMSGLSNAQNMSNNSATFVLKGQDLLLSVNRAQKASHLL
jgi:hypothetical protein